MHLSLSRIDLALYVRKQLENLFPDSTDLSDLTKFVDLALGRVEHCFLRVRLYTIRRCAGSAVPKYNGLFSRGRLL